MDNTVQAKEIFHQSILNALANNASDIHFSPQVPVRMRRQGQLVNIFDAKLTADEVEDISKLLLSIDAKNEITSSTGDTDFAMDYQDQYRFRINVAKTRKGLTIALRFLPHNIPTMEELGLPAKTLKGLVNRQRGGIILVTGPTGSGKTTTLASIIDYINQTHASHIVTIEAPVEYVHEHKKCNVDQRELPVDSPSFGSALRASLRQDPDVIMVGEMRDLETISAAITAAETGHLVFSTLHTNSAAETINRVIDAFPQNQQQQIRTQLAASLIAVISQRLIPCKEGTGRVAAFELMIANTSVRAHIRDDKTLQIASDIQTGKNVGMISFDECLMLLCHQGKISGEQAKLFAIDPNNLKIYN